MPRFFVPAELSVGLMIDLPDTVAHHCRVLRLATGDTVQLFNGNGGAFVATLCAIEKKRISATLKLFDATDIELPYAITLAQALPEAGKMDWIIEKAIELGAAAIQPLTAARCVTRLNAERAEKRRSHWHSVLASACEQCGRNRLPVLGELLDFKVWVAQQDLHRRVVLTPYADQSLSSWVRHHPAQALTLMIGPEGGLTEQEIELAVLHGALALSMGPRVLRTETAGLSAIATINAHWGDLT